MKKLGILLLAALITFFFTATSYAGPWTLNKGKLWTEVFTRYYFAKEKFDSEGNRSRWPNDGHSRIYDLEGKAEYGLTDRLNLQLGVPYAWSRWSNDYGKLKHEGFKRINIGAKYKFMDNPVCAAIQAKAMIHPGDVDKVKQPDLFEYGSALEARLMVGKSFSVFKRPSYFSTEVGYELKSNWINEAEYGNKVPIFAELGFSPFDWLMLKGEIDISITHRGTGKIKDTYTWRAGPIINLMGKGFSSIEKGGDSSLNVEFLYGRTFYGQGDESYAKYRDVSAADEYIAKVQVLW